LLLQFRYFGYAQVMASERMMMAIGALERAISNLEQQVAAQPRPAPEVGLSATSASQARAALKSLDQLITELKVRTDG
jgi:hypothetical protein